MVAVGCGSDDGDGDETLFCDRLDRLTRNDPFRAFGESASASDIQVAFGALLDRADELVESAPPEARPAALDYQDAAEALDSLLAGAAYVGSQVDARAYHQQQVAYTEAAQRLERYLSAEC
jgi:hypothetical protein